MAPSPGHAGVDARDHCRKLAPQRAKPGPILSNRVPGPRSQIEITSSRVAHQDAARSVHGRLTQVRFQTQTAVLAEDPRLAVERP